MTRPTARFRSPTKFSGEYVYKYHRNVDWLEPIILKGELYFPTPSQLNDPNEARPKLVRRVSPEGLVTSMYNESLQSALSKGHGPTEHLLLAAQGVRKFGVERLVEISEQRLHQQFKNRRTRSGPTTYIYGRHTLRITLDTASSFVVKVCSLPPTKCATRTASNWTSLTPTKHSRTNAGRNRRWGCGPPPSFLGRLDCILDRCLHSTRTS